MADAPGKVYLVGAGPGDPGLITVRGRECLERADVVIYDALANDVLLEYAPRAERIFAGKARDRHTLIQEEINRLLLDYARKVSRVVRLKGGDPFVFGRGGEEALFLVAHGVPFEVVPGVTAGIAAPAYAGIPVTHRGLTTSFTVISGHAGDEEEGLAAHLDQLALRGTLAFYMGVKTLPRVVAELLRVGRSPDTPAAAIEWGTYARQRTITGTLRDIADRCAGAAVRPPALVIVGEVVSLHEQLGWFESRPLFGRRIVVTRAQAQAGDLVHRLRELGADVFEYPTIRIEPVAEAQPFDPIGTYDWVVLTSVNAVDMLFERLDGLGLDARDLAGVQLCVIGSATADAVRRRFLRIDLMPERYVAEHLMAALPEREPALRGKRFLLPRADIARGFLPEELRRRGAVVTELVAYRTVMPETSEELSEALMAYQPHLITFTSSSTATNFARLVGPGRIARLRANAAFASIGPVTSDTLRALGLGVAVEPRTHDIPSLVEAIVDWARGRA